MALPSGVSLGFWMLPSWVVLPVAEPGNTGMMAESGRSIGGGGGATVVVVVSSSFLSSLPFLSLAVVVVGAGAAGPEGLAPAEVAGAAVVVVVGPGVTVAAVVVVVGAA